MTRHQFDTPRLWRHFDLRNSALDRAIRRAHQAVEPPPRLLFRLLAALHADSLN